MQPTVRHFIACEDIQRGSNPERFTLVQVITRIRSLDPVRFPLYYRELCFLAMCSSCRGEGRIQLRILEEEPDQYMYLSPVWTVSFGNDPLLIVAFPFRIHDIVFDRPGIYLAQLWYKDQGIAEEPLRVSE